MFQVPLGSLSIVKEPKASCIYKLKIAEVLGKVAADGEALCGSLHPPGSPSVGSTRCTPATLSWHRVPKWLQADGGKLQQP